MPLTKAEKKFIEKLGKRIVTLREERGMRQIDLARALEMEDSALRRIESGRTNPTTTTLLSLAEALEIEVSELFPSIVT